MNYDKGGEIQVVDGYFVHFVAPENLPPMAKHVIFVLDVSGSMEGKKMVQLKNAMKTILTELRANDFFSIVEFSDNVTEWRKEATAVNEKNIKDASNYVNQVQSSGGTNIHAGLMAGLSKVKHIDAKNEVQPMIIFLTDGKLDYVIFNLSSFFRHMYMVTRQPAQFQIIILH